MKKSHISCDEQYHVQVCQTDLKIIIIMLKIMLMHLFCNAIYKATLALSPN